MAAAESVLHRFVAELAFRGGSPRELNKFDRRLDRIRKKLRSFSGSAIRIGTVATGAAVGVLKVASDFEKGFADMAARTGKSMADLEARYGRAVLNIGQETGVAFAEIQDAFQKGISAGLEGEQLIRAVTQAAKASAAGIAPMSQTLSAATTAWSVLGVEADRAMDIIAAAAQKGEGDSADYGHALKSLVGFAKILGVEFDELSAGMAAVSLNAPSVREGMTQYRAFLKAIAKPSETAVKALKELNAGFDFEDLRKVIKDRGIADGFASIKQWLDDLKKSGKDVAPIMGQLFPEVEALTFIGNTDPAKIREIAREIREVDNVINDAFRDTDDTMHRQFTRMMRGLEVVVKILGDRLKPAFMAVTRAAAWMIRTFKSLPDWGKDIAAGLVLIGPALLGLGVAAGVAAFALGGLGAAWTFFTAGLAGKAIVATLAGIKFAILGIAGAIKAVTIALLTNPLILLITAIAAAMAFAAYKIWQNWELIVDFVERSVNWVIRMMNSLIRAIPGRGVLKRLGIEIAEIAEVDLGGTSDRPGGVGPERNIRTLMRDTVGHGLTDFLTGSSPVRDDDTYAGELAAYGAGPDVPGLVPLPVPPADAAIPPGAAGPINRTVAVQVGDVIINAEGADADELYVDATRKFERQLRVAFEGADSEIAR